MNELAGRVVGACRSRGLTLATCESLTGGLLGAALTSVPGASAVYRGGLITYATDLKAALADVDRTRLAIHGPVDEQVACQMALGARARCGADWGIATTGVAGPDPQDGVPVGTVWIALAGPETKVAQTRAELLHLAGDRAQIREAAVEAALAMLLRCMPS